MIRRRLSPLARPLAVAAAALLLACGSRASREPGPIQPPGSQASDSRARMIERLRSAQTRPFDQPQEAMAYYWSRRSRDGRPLGLAALERAAIAAAALPLHAASGPAAQAELGAWQLHGPGNVGGRSRALVIDRRKPSTMWTAGVAGGVWKSIDGGASWQPKSDLLVNIAVTSLAQDPVRPSVLYAGTGEGFFNADGARGQGIFRSTDGGETWRQLPRTAGNPDFFFVQKLAAMRNSQRQRLYAATRTGLFRSSDSGTTWTKVIDAAAVNGCMDIAVQDKEADGDAPRYVFASCGTFAQATVYRALDVEQDQLWEPVLRQPNMGRTSLAVALRDPRVVYALASFYNPAGDPQNHGLLAVFRSADSGAAGSWETRVHHTDPVRLNTVQLSNPVFAFFADCFGGQTQLINQGWYDNQIAVDPIDPDIVWSTGVDLMRSDDGGRTWGVASYWWFDATDPNFSHADQHGIAFHPLFDGRANQQMFVVSDGGVFRTDEARQPVGNTVDAVCGDPVPKQVRWTSLNHGYQVTQFYHGAVYPDGSRLVGGTQDNGTVRGGLAPDQPWQRVSGGDGGYVAVNRDDPNVLYDEFTGKSLQRSLDGGQTFTAIHGGVAEAAGNFLFVHPYTLDPTTQDRMWYGGASAWRSGDRGTTWVRVSNGFGARISAWAVAPSRSDRVYAGTQQLNAAPAASGRIHTTDAATSLAAPVTWDSAQPRQGFVSSIAVDPNAPTTAYATYSTYDFAGQAGHVFKTVDGGATWTRIDRGLPDMPVHSVVVHPSRPDTLYIGTDLGVFVTTDGGATWLRENTGFANTVVEHLELNGGRLFAFTHGRSAWSTALGD